MMRKAKMAYPSRVSIDIANRLSTSYGRTVFASLAGLAGIIALLVLSLINEYQVATQHAQREVENISRVLEGHASATVHKADLLLREIQRNVHPDDMRQTRGVSSSRRQELHALLKSQLENIPEVAFIHVTNAMGNHIYSSFDPVPHINIADRYHFLRHRDDAAAGLVISPPLVSRTTGKWTVVLTRRLNFEDGSFAGIINVILDLEYFQQFYRTLNLGTHGLVALYDKELHLAARYPPSENGMGKISNLYAKTYIEKGIKHAVYRTKSPVDGVDRMYGFRQVGDLPLFVFAGIAEDDYLAEWRRHTWQYGISVAILSIVVIGFGLRQRRAEEQLNAASVYARSLIEASLDPLVTIRADGKIMDVNSATENVTGWVRGELIGSDFSDYFTEPEKARMGYLQAFSQGQVTDYPLAIRHTSGKVTDVLYNASIYRDAQGKVAGVFAAARDITERKRLEQEKEQYFRFFLLSIDPMCIADPYGCFKQINPAFVHLTGFSESELVARPFLEFVLPEDRQRTADEMKQQVEVRPSLHFENRYVCKDGAAKLLSWTAYFDKNDGATYATAHDITESRQAEKALQALNETLERRVREETAKNMAQERLLIQQSRLAAMGEMIGNIAHQWRQPINAMGLILANIKDAYEFNELTKEYLDSEVETGQVLTQKMSNTIDDFRNFFKPNKEKQRFIACDSVEEAIKLVSHSFKNSDIELTHKKCAEPCAVFGYPNEFAQVVLNVLTNAKEAIVGKKIHGKVLIHAEKGTGTATISIRDNGGTVPEEVLPKVFDPYFTTKEKGSGIGLYMSKMIMDNMGGDIIIRNVEDGAEVLLTLPLAVESHD